MKGPTFTQLTNSANAVLKTGLVPAASGSAYLELEAPPKTAKTLLPTSSTLKLTCSVHGPKPVARTASFSPNLQLSAIIKFGPFATRQRRGYVRDAAERDLGVHLETALKGMILPARWPKSAIDVVVTVLEGEEDNPFRNEGGVEGAGLMNVLGGCMTVASAALADARIDCLDLLAGVVAGVIQDRNAKLLVLDPCPSEHESVLAMCVLGYLPNRDEITELWVKGDAASAGGSDGFETLMDNAVNAAKGVQTILQEAVRESAERSSRQLKAGVGASNTNHDMNDVDMKT